VTHDPNAFKKIAVLTGLTVLIGGTEISKANANTTTPQTDTFFYSIGSFSDGGSSNTSNSLSFNGFNTSLGTLTEVDVQLNSYISSNATSLSASVALAGQSVGSTTSTGEFDKTATFTTSLSSFETATITAALSLMTSDGFANWSSSSSSQTPEGLTVSYEYTPISATPLPATLPLFAGGLAGLGFTTWRRRQKQTAKE
jgi:hypothetical protein